MTLLAAVANRGEIRKSLPKYTIGATVADSPPSHSSMLLTLTHHGSYLRAIGLTDLPNGKSTNLPYHSGNPEQPYQLVSGFYPLQTGTTSNSRFSQAHELSLHTVAVFR